MSNKICHVIKNLFISNHFIGHYCLHATPPTPYPEGTFNNRTGLAAEDECTHCSVGMFCMGLGNIVPSGTYILYIFLLQSAQGSFIFKIPGMTYLQVNEMLRFVPFAQLDLIWLCS